MDIQSTNNIEVKGAVCLQSKYAVHTSLNLFKWDASCVFSRNTIYFYMKAF